VYRSSLGVGEVLRYHSDTLSEQYRSRRGAPIRGQIEVVNM
jgi:hypothetical protein